MLNALSDNCDNVLEMMRLEMTAKIRRVVTDMRTRITFVGLSATRDFYMSSAGNVLFEACPYPEVFVTTLTLTGKTRFLLDN